MEIRDARPDDARILHELAARTFPLATPPGATQANIDDFIARNLSETSFDGYLVDPARFLFIAEADGVAVGYTMLVLGEPKDTDVSAAITVRPTIELSKVYVVPEQHGAGVAAALVAATVERARELGAAGIWLGVNQLNDRANRFYEKTGFARVGTKQFLVGDNWEDDFVRELVL